MSRSRSPNVLPSVVSRPALPASPPPTLRHSVVSPSSSTTSLPETLRIALPPDTTARHVTRYYSTARPSALQHDIAPRDTSYSLAPDTYHGVLLTLATGYLSSPLQTLPSSPSYPPSSPHCLVPTIHRLVPDLHCPALHLYPCPSLDSSA